MIYRCFLVFILFLSSCQKRGDYDQILIIGHGGMGLDHLMSIYHDNTFESVELALEFSGVNGVEVDVQMDLDGELWLCHDTDLSLSLGVDGSIPEYHTEFLEEQSYETIRKEKLCKLRDVIHLFDDSDQLFIDVKSFNPSSGIIVDPMLFKEALDAILMEAACEISVILVNGSWVSYFVDDYQTYLDTDSKSIMDSYLSSYPQLAGLVVRYESLSRTEIQDYLNQNWQIYLYEIRSVKRIRNALEKRPSGILPDDIRRALIEAR